MPEYEFTVNITGPDGKSRLAGDPVPTSWPVGYVKSLVSDKAARATRATPKRAKPGPATGVEHSLTGDTGVKTSPKGGK